LQLIYGVLASVPILLIWIFINWTIILSGVVFVSIYENRYIESKSIKEDKSIVISIEIRGEKIPKMLKSEKISKKDIKNIIKEVLDESVN